MIVIPKICGTCTGASNAINTVYDTYNKEQKKSHPKKIVIYKEILHNKRVINDLSTKGIKCIETLDSIDSNNIVIIRAHGEGKNTYELLKRKNIEYVDATCKNVLRIHEIIEDKYKKNYSIIIIGKNNHPEVEGSNGWCDNNAYIINNKEDITKINNLNNNVLIICQTTYNEDEVKEYAKIIQAKFKDKQIEFVNTICNAQKLIQTYSIKVAKEVDYMIVIGGKNSSNTNELYKKCLDYCKAVKVSTIEELDEWLNENKQITKQTKIGLTGGASTPQHEINEFKEYLEKKYY